MGFAVAIVGTIISALLVAALFALLNTVSRGVDAQIALGDDSSPFSAPGEDARIEGVASGFPSELSEAFRIDAILDRGWSAVRRWPLPLFVGGFVLTLIESCNNMGSNIGDIADIVDDFDSESASFMVPLTTDALAVGAVEAAVVVAAIVAMGFVFAFFIVIALAKSWITNGWLVLHRDLVLRGEGQLSTVFTRADRVLALWLNQILVGLVVFLAVLVSAIAPIAVAVTSMSRLEVASGSLPLAVALLAALFVMLPATVYAALGTWLSPWFVVYDRSGPWTALLQSWDAARGNRLTFFAFLFVITVVNLLAWLLGILLLCVGTAFTVPVARAVTDLAVSRAWLTARHGSDRAMEFHA